MVEARSHNTGMLGMKTKMHDNGGRRSGIDRRQFAYAGHVPERRHGLDRRSGFDRRNGVERRSAWQEWSHLDEMEQRQERAGPSYCLV